ncbi:MAG: PKD domain-containing protein [Fulvivirga sp.]
MFKYKVVIILLFALVNQSLSQCLVTDFDISGNSTCKSSKTEVTYSGSSTNFIIDFCADDMASTPEIATSLDISSVAANPFGYDIVHDGSNWFGFIVDKGNAEIIRLDFGSNPNTNPSQIQTLSSLGIVDPEDIFLDSIQGEWYALVTTDNGNPDNDIYLLDFGTNLSNSSPTVTNLGNFGAVAPVRGASYIYDGSRIVLIIPNNRSLILADFQDSFYNTPTQISTPNVANHSIFDLDIHRKCDEWFVIAPSLSRLNLVSFGNDIMNSSPSVVKYSFPNPIISFNPFEVDIFDEGDSSYVFVGNLNDPYRMFSLGDLRTDTPREIAATSDEFTSGSVIYFNGGYYIHGLRDNAIDIVEYRNECGAFPEFTANTSEFVAYDSSGNHKMLLTEFSADKTLNTHTESITITTDQAPDIDFTTSFPISCVSNPIVFTAVSSADDIQFYDWDFGDGNTSTDENPSHTYASPGTYDVKLSVTDADPCENFTLGSITIYEDPVSSFDPPSGVVCNNQTVTFTNTTPDSFEGNESFEWQVDGVTVSTSRDLDYEFTTGGTFEVKLITSIPGCSDETIQNFDVTEGPSPNFIVSDGCVGTLFDFINTTTGDNIVAYQWDFDNGFMSSEENPDPFEYDSPGTYNVTLSTENAAGCITSIEKSLTVYDPPVVDFSNELSCELDPTQFTDLSIVNNANIESWQWNFGDPASGSNSSTDQNPQHIFSQSGDFTVRLITTTTFGCIDSLTQVVSVNEAPNANFSFDKVCLGEEIQFQDESEAVPGEQITNWAWNLGGQFSAEQNPSATFDFAIDYNVSLTVTSQNLCSNTVQENITVYPAQEVGFKVEDACENVLVHLYDTTQQTGDRIESRVWQFADQGSAMDSSVFNDFTAGDYDVTLGVTTERGCEYEGTQTVTINEAPEASFEASNVFGAPPLEVGFTDNSNLAISHSWDFGNGSTSNQANPTNIFNEEGSYNVSLAIEDANGCRDTTSLIINALVPELELELQQVTIVDQSIVLTMINNGTLSIDSMTALVNLGDRVVVEEEIVHTLPSSNNPKAINYTLDLNLASRNVDYVCVTLTPILNGAEDSNSINNTKCKNFEANIIFIKPYPNPANEDLNITIMSETEGDGNIRLISSIGEVVLTENFNGVRGKNDIQLDVSSIKGGVYLVEVEMVGVKSNARVAIDN